MYSVGSCGCGAADEAKALTESFSQARVTFFLWFFKLLLKNFFGYLRKRIHKRCKY